MSEARPEAEDAAWAALSRQLGFAPGVAPEDELWQSGRFRVPETRKGAASRADRRFRVVGLVAGAAAALLVAGNVVWWSLVPAPVQPAAIAVLSEPAVLGYATVEALPGSAALRVTVGGDPAFGTYREVWLLSEDGADAVSLGALRGSTTALPLPAGTDLAGHPVVAVSSERLDGGSGFSGRIVVSGILEGTGQSATGRG